LHSRSVALVLNIDTGLCSPQFHADFDDFFESVKDSDQPISWPAKCYFTEDDCHVEASSEPPIPDTIVLPPSVALPEPSIQSETQDSQVSEGDTPPQQQQSNTTHESANAPTNAPSTASEQQQQASPPTGANMDTGAGVRHSTRTRTRTIRPPQRLIAETAFIAQAWDDVWDIQDFEIQDKLDDPIAFAANSNPDVMYYHEALKAPDRKQFIDAMKKEVADHEQRGHWELVRVEDIPSETKILPAVWSMKCKRRIATGEIYKWKARLNVHGGKQEKGIHFWETYSPVVSWFSIRVFLIIAIINGWHTRQVDFVLAYPQADIETELYMQLPKGFTHKGE